LKVHEFQAKQVMAHYDIPVPEGYMVESKKGVKNIAEKLLQGSGVVAVKAQIHAGGRGKGGGIKIVKSADEAEKAAEEMLGRKLVTAQTGPGGREVKKVLVEEGKAVEREFYVSLILDRSVAMPAIIVSREGGVEIEEVAARNPEAIKTVRVDPVIGLREFQVRELNSALGLEGDEAKQGRELFYNLFQMFMELDCRLAEINPLVVTGNGKLLALDAKIDFDDSALYRHPDIAELRDKDEEDPLEVDAGEHNLSYIKLDGNIGCMVNGAGLAMATMDMIKNVGLEPANFLDVGGGASQEMIENAFRILLRDQNVKGVLVNIFGGILRCDVLARGLVEAGKKLSADLPMVIRLEGTNVEEGRSILADSGLDFIVAENFEDAADKLKQVMQAR